MAAGSWIPFNIAKLKLANGTFDLDTQTFKMALCTDAPGSYQIVASNVSGGTALVYMLTHR